MDLKKHVAPASDTIDLSMFTTEAGYEAVPLIRVRLSQPVLEYLSSCIRQEDSVEYGQTRRDLKDNALKSLEQLIAANRYSFGLGTPFILTGKSADKILHQGAHRVTSLLSQKAFDQEALIIDGAPIGLLDYIDTNVTPRSGNDIAKSRLGDASSQSTAIATYACSLVSPTGRRREITQFQRNALCSDVAILQSIQRIERDIKDFRDAAPKCIHYTPLVAMLFLAEKDSAQKYKKAREYARRILVGGGPSDCPATVARQLFIARKNGGGKNDRDFSQRLYTSTFDSFMSDTLLDPDTYMVPQNGAALTSLNVGWLKKSISFI